MHDNREKIIDEEYGDWSDTWYSSDDGYDEDIEVIVDFDWELDSLNEGHSDYQDEHYWEYDAEDKHDGFGNYIKPPWISVGRRTRLMREKKKRRQLERKKAEDFDADSETFEAVSPYGPNLNREKKNIADAVSASYGSFKWSDCTWGPHFLRFSGEGSNKFYSVWVWERSPGVYTAMGAYGGLGQNPRLFNITQTADLQRAVNEAQKKMNQKQNKGYGVYN